MITLYGMGSPNVVKVFIALEELAIGEDRQAGRAAFFIALRDRGGDPADLHDLRDAGGRAAC